MIYIKLIFLITAAYFIGGFSVSILLSRFVFGKDVRSCGSGNAGATNMARSFGMKMGLITLVCDALKAVVAMLIGKAVPDGWGVCIAGIACLLGHCYPALHDFRGGKGVSVCAALVWAIDWRVGVSALTVFIVAAALSRRVSLGSVCAAAAVSLTAFLLSPPLPELILAVFCTVTVILRHRENIRRLISGTEPEFKCKKEK